jgi:hypothetical protein
MQSSYFVAPWIASWSLSSGARSRDPLARNDDLKPFWLLKIELGIRVQIHVVPAKRSASRDP